MVLEIIELFCMLKIMMQHILIIWVLEMFQKRLKNLKVIKIQNLTFSNYKEVILFYGIY